VSDSVSEKIVYTRSEDGLLLEGAVIRHAAPDSKPVGLVWVHGMVQKFYFPTTVEIGRDLATRGYVFVTGNNRGHDFGAMIMGPDGTPRLIGGAWERFDESPRDVAAWIDLTMQMGVRGVVLIGHSLGALKITYYQARRQDSRVVGLIAASPGARAGRVYGKAGVIEMAEQMVADGRGRDLLPWGISPYHAGTISAEAYLNRVRTNIDTFGLDTMEPDVSQIGLPLLAFYGSREENVGGEAELAVIRQNARRAPRVDTQVIDGADHDYTGCERRVADLISDWVEDVILKVLPAR